MRAVLILAVALSFVPQCVLAGPNAGGVLVIHDANLVYTLDTISYCGLGSIPDSCAAIDAEVDSSGPDNQRVWKVYAVFPDTASPRLKAMSFGVHYPPDSLIVTAYGACIGDVNNGAMEIPGPNWPGNDTGTVMVFQETQTGHLVECYWLAGYNYLELPRLRGRFSVFVSGRLPVVG
jgi:hypothetical protein